MNIERIYEDDDLLIVNKPPGVLVIPDRFNSEIPSLNRILESELGQHIWVVHRIDRYTSGLVCFTKNEEAHKYMSRIFQERYVNKFYLGLVNGRVIPTEGRIEKAIVEHPAIKGKMTTAKKGKPSITDYQVVEQWPLYSLVQFRIHTGRTHQVRVHIQSVGNSIVCDDLYGDGKPFLLSGIKKKFKLSGHDEEERPLISRLALHAWKLAFKKADGTDINVEAPLPKDMAAAVKQLNKWAPKD
ncbi:MAG: RluA family pseudouridine synthase [Flavipsychrobacter sp.]|nr:RluA family pseudouridine synthase [Flavipsychrobacter sp.]